jgi:hypothetical protein
MEGNEEVKKR